MSVPQILPTLGSVTHAKGGCICLISLDSTGGLPSMPYA